MNGENPVLRRELLDQLRSPRAFILQAAFVALLGGIVLVAWPGQLELRYKEMKSVAIYDAFARGQFLLLALLAPILSAPGLAAERERRSLDLLLTSPLSPERIVRGKFYSAVAFLLLLAISSLPIFSCCFLLGGIGHREVAATYLLLLTAAALAGAIGLYAGVRLGRSRAALAASYAIILPAALVVAGLNPLRNLLWAAILTGLGLGGAALLLRATRLALGRELDETPRTAEEEDTADQLGLTLNRSRFPDNLISPQGSDQPLPETSDPIYEKELRYELFGRGTLLMRILLQVTMIAALPFFVATLAAKSLWLYSYYVAAFIMLIAPSLTAGIFTQERERGTLDLLLTTPLTPAAILRGKLRVNLRNVAILAALPGLLFIPLWVLAGMHPWFSLTALGPLATVKLALFTAATLGATLFMAVGVTALFSLICRTTLRAMVGSFLALSAVFVAPVGAFWLLTSLGDLPVESWRWLNTFSPFPVLAALCPTGGGEGLRHFLCPPAGRDFQPAIIFFVFCAVVAAGLRLAMSLLYDRSCQFRHEHGE